MLARARTVLPIIAVLACAAVPLAAFAAYSGRSDLGPVVNRLLPWHKAVLDRDRKLLAWHRPGRNLGYDRVLRLGWDFVERRVPLDRKTRAKVYLVYPVIDERTFQGTYWQHNPAFLHASFVESLVAWYPYSGDRKAIAAVRGMLDYQLRYGTTPTGWKWPRVPFPTSCSGDRRYGRCFSGFPRRFYGGIEPDKVGLLGRGYLLFYELTGERRYLRAALDAGNALARHVRPGDATRTPWPFRVHARTGAVLDGAQYGGAVIGPVRLLDELVRLRAGRVNAYRRARDLAWRWLLAHPLNRSSPAWNRWSGFYEDVAYNIRSRNQASPTLTADYLLSHPAPASIDPAWKEHTEEVLRWVRSSFGRGPFFGAWGIDEQRAPGRPGCCSPAGLGSDTARWAAMQAVLYERTGDPRAREQAVRSLNYATYFARRDGLVACCGRRPANTYWFSDGYSDYLRHFNQAMAAIPELAPRDADHLLGSTSVVRYVTYGSKSVAYRTFRAPAVEVLRLASRPVRVTAGGRPLAERTELAGEGFVAERLADGDYVVRVRHNTSRSVQIRRA